jgi:hypothetical protein
VRSADGDGKRITAGFFYEIFCFVRVSKQLIHIQLSFCAVAVFFTHHAGFQRTQATQLAFNRYATGVSHVYNRFGLYS